MAALPGRATGFTVAALVAFAANSWLCRFALRGGDIDPVAFTALRVAGGAVVLWPLARALEPRGTRGGSWPAALALFAYAIGFSLAYAGLDTAVGALLLFGAVQVTMIGAGLRLGERLGPGEWIGLVAALAGLAWLAAPGLAGAAPGAGLCMLSAGVAWGIYSLLGRGRPHPFAGTAGNFLRAAPLALLAPAVAALLGMTGRAPTPRGVLLAVASGALTSGLGYVLWYAALRDLAASTAGIVQLPVPVLTAAGGIVFLGEHPTRRLAVAGALILGGVALAVIRRRPATRAAGDGTAHS